MQCTCVANIMQMLGAAHGQCRAPFYIQAWDWQSVCLLLGLGVTAQQPNHNSCLFCAYVAVGCTLVGSLCTILSATHVHFRHFAQPYERCLRGIAGVSCTGFFLRQVMQQHCPPCCMSLARQMLNSNCLLSTASGGRCWRCGADSLLACCVHCNVWLSRDRGETIIRCVSAHCLPQHWSASSSKGVMTGRRA
jgi:hypothetical protein